MPFPTRHLPLSPSPTLNHIRNLQIRIPILQARNLTLPKLLERNGVLRLETLQLLRVLHHAVERLLPPEALDLIPQLVAGEVHEVLSQRAEMGGQALVVHGSGDEGLVAVRAGGAAGVQQARAHAVAEAVQSALFDGHAAAGERDV